MGDKRVGMKPSRAPAKLVLEAARRIDERGLTPPGTGNVSMLAAGLVYITPAKGGLKRLGGIEESDISIVSLEGEALEGPQPSTELPAHLMIYRRCRNKISAIVHAHPPYATAYAHVGIAPTHLAEAMALKIEVIPYHPPGSRDLAEACSEAVSSGADTLMLAKHGVLTVGGDLSEACTRLELIEYLCKLDFISRAARRLLVDSD
ncbi:MAG: hypothetical protein DRN96_02100 [Thermoproteota archaeon]|nr:MAG: hypothetical protein DRN96_02100 [Candidatus Korarchaeota archaeon]